MSKRKSSGSKPSTKRQKNDEENFELPTHLMPVKDYFRNASRKENAEELLESLNGVDEGSEDDMHTMHTSGDEFDELNAVDDDLEGGSLLVESFLGAVARETENNTVEDQFSLAQVLKNLENDKVGATRILQKHLHSIVKSQSLPTRLSNTETDEVARRARYEFAAKDINKWIPQLVRQWHSEQLVFGAEEEDLLPSVVKGARPINDFELELKKAFETSNTTKDKIRLKASQNIQNTQQARNLARIHSLMFAQQREAKRINKIKSKSFRRHRRLAESSELENLISRLDEDNPQVAAEIRKSFEEKRAKMRLQKQHTARKRWAQMAMRFGGRDVQREVDRQMQKAVDEKLAIDKLSGRKMNADLNTDESDGDDLDLNSDEGTTEKAKSILVEQIEKLENPTEKQKGVMGMKFMREAVEKQREENKANAQKLLKSLEGDEPLGSSSSDETDDVEDDNPTFTESQLAEARDQLAKRNVPTTFTSLVAVKPPTEKRPTSPNVDVNTHIEECDVDELHSRFENNNNKQRELVRQAFVEGDVQNDFDEMAAQAESNPIEEDPLAGWTSWVGFGIGRKPKKIKFEKPKPKNQKIIIGTKFDAKLAKYFVDKLPRPFANPQQYDALIRQPLGQEWNSVAGYRRFTQPAVSVVPGAVVMPLEYAKQLPPEEVDSLLRAWDDKPKLKRTKSRL